MATDAHKVILLELIKQTAEARKDLQLTIEMLLLTGIMHFEYKKEHFERLQEATSILTDLEHLALGFLSKDLK